MKKRARHAVLLTALASLLGWGCSSSNDSALPPSQPLPEAGVMEAGAPSEASPSEASPPDASAPDSGPTGQNGLKSIAGSPQGAALKAGSSLQFSVTCTYSDASHDNCARAGGLTWSSSLTTGMTVSSAGLATWVTDPGAGQAGGGYVLVSAGGLNTRAGVYGQHPGDTWYQYPTPDYRHYRDASNVAHLNVAVGSIVTMGSGLVINNDGSGGQSTGQPFGATCTWTSSNPAVATVDLHGQATGVSPGTATIVCSRAGDAAYGKSALEGWISPGNSVDITVVAGGAGNTTWYVRPDGGTPFVNAAQTPTGQCNGLSNQPYPGSGVNQACAFGNVRYLWSDETTYQQLKWVITGGDTVIVAQNPNGYNTGLDQPSPYQTPPGSAFVPINCSGNPGCTMPSIPSGTAARHTRILGEKFASCHDDAAKTKLNVSYAATAAFNLGDSQFVDIACFEISDKAACATNGNFTNACNHDDSSYGSIGIGQSALTSMVTYTDMNIHGLASAGIYGATGVGVAGDYVRVAAAPEAGMDFDDGAWDSSNISVAGGYTLTHSITEFSGCVEEYPITHQYPYIECRDQNTGGYADGFGTASTTGDWVFDHDVWRYNFQDGLDLLHSGMQSLTVTNSMSYGNDGQAYKIGSGDTVVFRNNIALVNCNRIAYVIGDEPASAVVPGVATCRAAGDGVIFAFTDQGSYSVQFNTFAGYDATPYDFGCEGGWDVCKNATAIYQNNLVLGYSDPLYNNGEIPGLFYTESAAMPPLNGWSVLDHNLFSNVRQQDCPAPLGAGETCDTSSPQFVNQPASPLGMESSLDGIDFHLSQGSPAAGAGVPVPGITTDIAGFPRANPPSLGALELGSH